MTGSSIVAIALATLIAGCGRLGFDPVEVLVNTCDTLPTAPLEVPPGTTALALCPGTTWLAVTADEGARLGVALAPDVPVAATQVELYGADQVRYAIPVWTGATVEATGTVTTSGTQLVRVEADLPTTAALTVMITAAPGRVFHIAPMGSDAGDGSAGAPWQTWAFALAQLTTGDTLITHDGAWTDRADCTGLASPCLASTPMPSAICAAGAAAGTSTRPITVIAQHPRQAHLASNGTSAGFAVEGCTGWVLDGLYASSTDQPIGVGNSQCPITALDSPGFIGRNLLVTHPNGCTNSHGICVAGTVTGSPGALIEDSEVYDSEHAGLFASDSTDVTLRRSYVHGRLGPPPACATVDGYPDRSDIGAMCFNAVAAPSCRLENLVVENVGDAFRGERSMAFEVHGSIGRNAFFGVLMQTAAAGAPPIQIEDLVCVDCDVGIWNRGVASVARGATLVGGRPRIDPAYGVGAWADPGALSSVWERVVAIDNVAAAFELFTSYTITSSVAAGSPLLFPAGEPFDDTAGSIQRSSTTAPPDIGDRDGACLVAPPPGSALAGAGDGGADIGASIVYRSVDGLRTQAKLWNQRTGAFPCGAIVPGVNDVPGASCFDLHQRLRVGVAGCPIP